MKNLRIHRLPPYVLGEVTSLMMKARRQGEDIINLGMGNPDQHQDDNGPFVGCILFHDFVHSVSVYVMTVNVVAEQLPFPF